MAEKNLKMLKPIYDAVEKLVPTNRALISFVNDKVTGKGIQRSINKVKFIEKSERSSKQLAHVTMEEFHKHLLEKKVGDDEFEMLMNDAAEILDDAIKQVEKVYGDVRRYVITGELRAECISRNYKKIPSMTDKQNDAIVKEMFSLALEFVNKGENRGLENLEEEFKKINYIALTLFNFANATASTVQENKKAAKETKSYFSLLDKIWD